MEMGVTGATFRFHVGRLKAGFWPPEAEPANYSWHFSPTPVAKAAADPFPRPRKTRFCEIAFSLGKTMSL